MKLGMITCIGRHKIKRINQLIKDIERNDPLNGIGNPEPLRGNLSGHYSRRINESDRLIHKTEDSRIYIAQCKGNNDDK